jgi:hypothetical protein
MEWGGRSAGRVAGGGGRQQRRFDTRGGRGRRAASGGPAAGSARGEGKQAGPKRNSEMFYLFK